MFQNKSKSPLSMCQNYFKNSQFQNYFLNNIDHQSVLFFFTYETNIAYLLLSLYLISCLFLIKRNTIIIRATFQILVIGLIIMSFAWIISIVIKNTSSKSMTKLINQIQVNNISLLVFGTIICTLRFDRKRQLMSERVCIVQ